MKRIIVVVGLVVAVALGTVRPAFVEAGVYPPRPVTVIVKEPVVEPGGDFAVTLNGCDPGVSVWFDFEASRSTVACRSMAPDDGPVGFATRHGVARAEFTAPDAPGDYRGEVSVDEPSPRVRMGFEVTVVDGIRPVSFNADNNGIGAPFGTWWTALSLAAVLALLTGFFFVASRRRT